MSRADDTSGFPGLEARRFVTTRWSEVLLAREQDAPGARRAQAILDQAAAQLREEYATAAKSELFQVLSCFLTEESRSGDYAEVATRLGMTPTTVAVTVHRLRQRYRQLIRDAVRPTVADP